MSRFSLYALHLLFAINFVFLTNLMAQQSSNNLLDLKSTPSWIWSETDEDASVAMRQKFDVTGNIKQAFLVATADNQIEVFLNGKKVLAGDEWTQPYIVDIARHVKSGSNIIAATGRNQGGAAGLIALAVIVREDGSVLEVATDGTWKVKPNARGNWRSEEFNDQDWKAARVVGTIGQSNLPWSRDINRDSLLSALGGSEQAEFTPELATHAHVPEGFKIERIFRVPRPMGSWVAITTDDRGRLIASDQGGAGLFLITPGTETTPTKVQKLPVDLSGAQGLLWAFDSLYVVINGGDKSGLHRARDTDGDGLVDTSEHCMYLNGGGEHGPHAVILSPDKQSLFVASGNHTKLPTEIAGSKIPQNWNEDLLLPRRWDANGHAAGILAPGGWICQVDPSGKQWNVFSMGFRNQYDIAFNADGELFTYDADMEWDFGSPWYRPTRVCHVTSGSEFGWRSGTGKWPAYYEDSLPAAIDIGPGSPTGIVFGIGAKFPARYQKSLFVLDWTYSTIYSIDLSPEGASYRGGKEDFVTGSPLPVTDAVIGHDGAMYFAAGGRGTQSDLYRVTYVGSEDTNPANLNDEQGKQQRTLRHQLEAFHGNGQGNLDVILQNLGHQDRFIRYAARIALESQGIDLWRSKVHTLTDTRAAINAMLALSRQGSSQDLPSIVETLLKLKYEQLDEPEKLMWLRTLEVAFTRLGRPENTIQQQVLELLEANYPTSIHALNAELVQILVYLESPSVVAKTLELMDNLGPEPIPDWGYLVSRNAGYGGTVGKLLADMPPSRGIHFAFTLRNAKTGWDLELRKRYFQFFIDASKKPGGNSYAKFLSQFRDDAMATCTPAELVVLAPLTGQSLLSAPVEFTPPKGPGRKWSVADALASLKDPPKKPNFESGRNLYHAASCSKCHRIAGEGGAIGPDLSTASKKFSTNDMLDAIIEPSKAISDQYGSQQVLTADGNVYVGRAVEIGDEVYVYTVDADAKPTILKKSDVEEMRESKVSQMPVGLVDQLNEQELRDLMAYLMSAGDAKSPVYK